MSTPHPIMTLGETLIALCTAGKHEDLWQAHYADDAISVEAVPMPDGQREAKGLAAIRAKNEWWSGAHEVHEIKIEGPYVHGADRFSVIFNLDVTQKETGERWQMQEIATYITNADGKIHREEFSYAV